MDGPVFFSVEYSVCGKAMVRKIFHVEPTLQLVDFASNTSFLLLGKLEKISLCSPDVELAT